MIPVSTRIIGCAHFNPAQFRACLFQLRALTGETPQVFQSRLVDLCRNAGVAVVIVPELPKLGVYGHTRWMGGKALIQLSQRFKSNDDFWWTFFHLAGHILLHDRKEVFIESAGCLQRDELLQKNRGNGLKVLFDWSKT